jgi:hypothetical protein
MTMVRFSSARLRMVASTSPTSSGSSAEVGSSNRITFHRQRPGNRHALLLAAGKAPRVGVFLARQADPGQQLRPRATASARDLLDHDRAFDDVFQRGAMGEQVEVLEHEAHVLAQTAHQALLLVERRLVSISISPTLIRPLVGFPGSSGSAGRWSCPSRWGR